VVANKYIYRSFPQASAKKQVETIVSYLQKHGPIDQTTVSNMNDDVEDDSSKNFYDAKELKTGADLNETLKSLTSLAKDAALSSTHCTCESSGRLSDANEFYRCSGCAVTFCSNCTPYLETESHKCTTLTFNDDNNNNNSVARTREMQFELLQKLRKLAPSKIFLSKESLKDLLTIEDDRHGVKGLHTSPFQLQSQSISRLPGFWKLFYYASHPDGRNKAEICIEIGEINHNSNNHGVTAFITSYAPCQETNKKKGWPRRGKIDPCAFAICGGKVSGRVKRGERNLSDASLRSSWVSVQLTISLSLRSAVINIALHCGHLGAGVIGSAHRHQHSRRDSCGR